MFSIVYHHNAACGYECFLHVGPPLPPFGHIWDVMLVWRKKNIEKKLSLCYSIVYYYNGAQRYEQFLQVDWCIGLSFCLHPSFYLLVNWAWWDWPLTWLTNHCPSVLWHCWLCRQIHQTVSEMTCNVLSGYQYHLTRRSTGSGFDLAWFRSVFRMPPYLWSSWCYIYIYYIYISSS